VSLDDQARRDLMAFGVQVRETSRTREEPDRMPIHPANWPSLLAFLGCETQWRVTGTMAGLIWLGLDYSSVDVIARLETWPREIWADIRDMEAAALPVLNDVEPS
jgi:hypothetical protein